MRVRSILMDSSKRKERAVLKPRLRSQVYKEPFAKRHYAGWFSTAVFYRLVAPILAIIVSFVVALTTGDMWVKNNVYLEQPSVKFGYDLVLVLEVKLSFEHFQRSVLFSLFLSSERKERRGPACPGRAPGRIAFTLSPRAPPVPARRPPCRGRRRSGRRLRG